jgi:multiple sugar transport system substrate-binding protein
MYPKNGQKSSSPGLFYRENRMDIKRIDRLLLYTAAGVLVFALLFQIVTGMVQPGNTTLVFTQWWQDDLAEGALSSLVREFEALHPGIEIRLDNRPYPEIRDRIIPNMISRERSRESSPDILGLDQYWLWHLVENGALEPLDEDPPNGEPVSLNTPDRKWALPLVLFINPLFYNIERLQAKGFNRPPKTRTELIEYAKALTEPQAGRFGLTLALSQDNPQGIYQDFFSWIWSSGTLTIRGGKADFSSPPVIETLHFLNRLYQDGCIAPGIFSKTETEKRREFLEGRAGMMIDSVSNIDAIRKQNPGAAFGVTTVPGPDAYTGKPAFGTAGWYAGIPQKSKHKDQARIFLSFLAEQSSLLTAKAHGVPANGNTSSGETDPLYSKTSDMFESGEAVQELITLRNLDKLEAIVREALYAMFEQNRSPEETAQTIQRRWDGL